MSRLPLFARLLLGVVFTVFSLDGVLHVVPLPALPQPALDFLGVLIAVRLFYAIKLLELVCGLLLLHGRFTTLAAVLLTPIVFNIVWFDAMLDPASLPVAVLLAGLLAVLLWDARDKLAPLFAGPSVVSEAARA
jgi:uncharacterized membrane protein YphA (DoxX/SURF4 family)